MISHLTGISSMGLPMRYLGCMLHRGRSKRLYFQHIEDSINSKLTGWSRKLLSQGGRLYLIKHVLSAIPMHVLVFFQPPKYFLVHLEQILNRFFWGV